MGRKVRKTIKWAAREKRRTVNSAVGKNFFKTITEPITNSDSAIKNLLGVDHASGLVESLLSLKTGDRVDSSTIVKSIPSRKHGRIILELNSAIKGEKARLCRVIDTGPGMSANELEEKFEMYAEAKAKGEKTRSLFGRGALDVLLYHNESIIYSVKDGGLSSCRIFWEDDTEIEVEDLGRVNTKLLRDLELPDWMSKSGTVVQFKLKDGTSVPMEGEIIDKISRFYMLRLIAADPNTRTTIRRFRADSVYESDLQYDFPVGTVLGHFDDNLDVGGERRYPINIFVARSDEPLQSDTLNIERRENGLLFVDENDAVFDITLLPEYDKSPYLNHIFGVVRIVGIRELLESFLEADEAVAVLTETRDGFNRKHEITKTLFSIVEKHVKPLYLAEEHRQKKGETNRSDELNRRIKDALKAINDFSKQETDDGEVGPPDTGEVIAFAVKSVQLYAGLTRNVSVFVNTEKVKNCEIVLLESDNPEIKVEPDSETVKHRKNQKYQRITIKLLCGEKDHRGVITALTLDKDGNEVKDKLTVLGVSDPPIFVPPEDIDFAESRFSGQPNRLNKATLLVNLEAFTGMPEITFWLEETLGNVSLEESAEKRIKVKVTETMVSEGLIARVNVSFNGTAWGQKAILRAKGKRKDGQTVRAKCRLVFHRPKGNDKFSDFWYEDLGRNILGESAEDKIYVNAGYRPHQEIFGVTQEDFDSQLESNPVAQMRAVTVLVETVVQRTAADNYQAGGKNGWQLDPNDPLTNLRTYLDERRMKLEPLVLKALAPYLGSKEPV
jgi:archaellum component FlaG (FlaF/FlaG flagellin family)